MCLKGARSLAPLLLPGKRAPWMHCGWQSWIACKTGRCQERFFNWKGITALGIGPDTRKCSRRISGVSRTTTREGNSSLTGLSHPQLCQRNGALPSSSAECPKQGSFTCQWKSAASLRRWTLKLWALRYGSTPIGNRLRQKRCKGS